jgi:hypothetical protein
MSISFVLFELSFEEIADFGVKSRVLRLGSVRVNFLDLAHGRR